MSGEGRGGVAARRRQQQSRRHPWRVQRLVESSTDAEKEEEEKEDGPFAKLFAGLGNNTEPPPFAYGSIAEVSKGQRRLCS